MSGDDRPVRPGIVETQGEQALTKRVDVIRETIRGLHQGQQPCGAARTGRTHGCTRPVLINAKNLLHRGGRPHMASDSRILYTYLGAGAVHPITSHRYARGGARKRRGGNRDNETVFAKAKPDCGLVSRRQRSRENRLARHISG